MKKLSIGFPLTALALGGLAVFIGLFFVWATAFPGPCGDSWGIASLGVLECWVIDVPIGIFALVVGLTVKKGFPRLRRPCIVVSLVALSLPIIVSFIWSRQHCP